MERSEARIEGTATVLLDDPAEDLKDLPAAQPVLVAPGAGSVLENRFELRELLGSGRAGQVFAAFERESGSEVAVRIIEPSLVLDGEARERLAEELQASAALSGRGFVKVHGIRDDGTHLFLWMDRLDGRTLRQEMEERQGRGFSAKEVLRLGRELCRALQTLHRLMDHGRIRPENIWLDHDDVPMLMDLGLARLVSSDARDPYRAPEWRGAAGDDADGNDADGGDGASASDQYALGAVLFELLAGRPPRRPLRAQAVTLRRSKANVLAVAQRALEESPARRYPDMAEFGHALAQTARAGSFRTLQWCALAMAGIVVGTLAFQYLPALGERIGSWFPDAELTREVEEAKQRAEAKATEWQRLKGSERLAAPELERQAEEALETASRLHARGELDSARDAYATALESHSRAIDEARRSHEDEVARAASLSDRIKTTLRRFQQEENELAVRLKELSRRQQDRNQTDKAREKARKDLEFLSKVHAYCQREVLRGRLDEVAGHLGAGERLVHEKYYDGAIEAYEKAWRLLEELQEKLDSAIGSGRVRSECAAQERAWSELSHSGRGRFREFLSSRGTFLEKESRARESLVEAERLAGLGEYGQAAPLFERANELFRALSVEAPAEYDAWQAMQQADRDGRTFLHRAAERGALEEAQDLLRRGATLDARDYQGATPLHLAARSGSVRLVEFLIERGASTSSRDRMNQTMLHFAVMGGNRSVVEALLRRGARRGRISKRGWAPIHLAITKGHTDIALLLIDSGTDVDLVDSTGLTPLHYACLHGQTELARRLVAQKARLDRKGGLSRNTPLHLAARQGHLEVVRFLLESGARARVPNAQGRYAVELGRRHQEVRELLRQHESGGGHP